jgi:hypothetical protein
MLLPTHHKRRRTRGTPNNQRESSSLPFQDAHPKQAACLQWANSRNSASARFSLKGRQEKVRRHGRRAQTVILNRNHQEQVASPISLRNSGLCCPVGWHVVGREKTSHREYNVMDTATRMMNTPITMVRRSLMHALRGLYTSKPHSDTRRCGDSRLESFYCPCKDHAIARRRDTAFLRKNCSLPAGPRARQDPGRRGLTPAPRTARSARCAIRCDRPQ